uniref:Uncharacterized protein n=1 Tax=Nelumbo nucifera TaxID=4432 RepID=A0A822YK37_NELNU|nr:TPA_asm: hypothetical protein HUJ06_010186 [Nelumbo nucifera]
MFSLFVCDNIGCNPCLVICTCYWHIRYFFLSLEKLSEIAKPSPVIETKQVCTLLEDFLWFIFPNNQNSGN